MGAGMGGIMTLIGGVIVLAILAVLFLLACMVVSSRAGVDITQVTDTSNIADVQGKIGQIKIMFVSLGTILGETIDELKSRTPILSKVFTAKGMSIVCFFLMLFFGIIPLKFTWGFTRVDFGVLWLLQIILLIVFAAVLAQKYFQYLIVPIGTYFLLTIAGWPAKFIESSKYDSGDGNVFKYVSLEFWNFSGVVFLLILLAIMSVFFLTYFMNRFQDDKPFIATCLIAMPVNYLAMCVSYGGLFRNFLLIFDFSFWMFNAFVTGIICLVIAKNSVEQHAAEAQQNTD